MAEEQPHQQVELPPADPTADDDTNSLEQPLLLPAAEDNKSTFLLSGGTSLPGSVVLLAKAIVGAGSAALPLAFARLGILFSVTFLLSVGFMTHFSLEALTLGLIASSEPSFPGAVRTLLGHSAALCLELCLVLRCAGLMIVYIVIAADLLAGGKALPGLICEITANADWCSNRHLITGILSILVLAPLVTPRKLSSATWTSILGMSAVGLWTAVTAVVAAVAAVRGKAFSPAWLPNSQALGGGTWASESVVALSTLPVIATAYTCQMTVAFIAGDLRRFSIKRMSRVSALAVSVCSLVFLIVGLGSIIAFGEQVPADILELFNQESLHHILGSTASRIIGIAVRLGFLISILANMPLQMLPYRQSLARLTLGDDQRFAGLGFYVVTYISLAGFYCIAMAAKSIWVPIQLVGATAGAAIAFFFPAFVAFAVVKQQERVETATPVIPALKAGYWRGNAWGLVAVGLIQAFTGIAAVMLEGQR